MRSRTFFHVSFAVFALAAAYHLGTRNAGAQSGANFTAAECIPFNGSGVILAQGRTVRTVSTGRPTFEFPPVPGSAEIVALGTGGGGEIVALLSNGDTYAVADAAPGEQWRLIFNAAGGPTSPESESWGSVKARYRGERAAATTER